MANRAIPAQSGLLTEDDLRKREIVRELIRAENQRIVDFAKYMLTVSFSAIGVVLALKDKWIGTNAPPHQKLLLGISIALLLATGLLATLAVSSRIHKVSESDYADVDSELHRIAGQRYRLTQLGFVFCVVATTIVAVVAICA